MINYIESDFKSGLLSKQLCCLRTTVSGCGSETTRLFWAGKCSTVRYAWVLWNLSQFSVCVTCPRIPTECAQYLNWALVATTSADIDLGDIAVLVGAFKKDKGEGIYNPEWPQTLVSIKYPPAISILMVFYCQWLWPKLLRKLRKEFITCEFRNGP